jgi:hypothetical protein
MRGDGSDIHRLMRRGHQHTRTAEIFCFCELGLSAFRHHGTPTWTRQTGRPPIWETPRPVRTFHASGL